MSWTMADIERKGLKIVGDERGRESRPNERKTSRVSTPEKKEIVPHAESQGAMRACEGYVYLPVTPLGKPRMTQRDKWKQRPAVMRYRSFCDSIRSVWHGGVFPMAGGHVVFHVPMPKSWSKKKKAEMDGQPHQQKPDIDNMLKALLDALHVEDKHIYDIRGTKRWSEAGYIEVFTTINPETKQ